MPTHDAEALVELARLCTEARTSLPATGFHRLRVLLDMILVDLAREGVVAERAAIPGSGSEADASPRPEAS